MPKPTLLPDLLPFDFVRCLSAVASGLWHSACREVDGTVRLPEGWKVSEEVFDSIITSSLRQIGRTDRAFTDALVHCLGSAEINRSASEVNFPFKSIYPYWLVGKVMNDGFSPQTLRAWCWRALRSRRRIAPNSSFNGFLQTSCSIINEKMAAFSSRKFRFSDVDGIVRETAVKHAGATPCDGEWALAFWDICVMTNYVSLNSGGGDANQGRQVVIRPTHLDSDYLFSCTFGLTTGINGLNNLFGGGGVVFPERDVDCSKVPSDHPRGRVLLIKGRCGTGKTLLALLLARELAMQGGDARVVPLEQSPTECLHMLTALGGYDGFRDSVVVDETWMGAAKNDREPGLGHLSILNAQVTSDLPKLLSALAKLGSEQTSAHLSVLVIDPISNVIGLDSSTSFRESVVDTLNGLRSQTVNVILVAEESVESGRDDPSVFLSNVSDTVIRLTVDRAHEYSQRYIEVEKSRLQREQRGRHPFSIRGDGGMTIFTSSAAVAARISSRRMPKLSLQNQIRFGVREIDDYLPQNTLFRGDMIAIRGPRGTFKTHLGLSFLLGTGLNELNVSSSIENQHARSLSLLVSARHSPDTLAFMIRQPFFMDRRRQAVQSGLICPEIELHELSANYLLPGNVFDFLDAQISRSRERGFEINRIMFDEIDHWESGCPFLNTDIAFADTLAKYLRCHSITSIMVCNASSLAPRSSILSPLIDNANVLIDTRKIRLRGGERAMLSLTKTRHMRHGVEAHRIGLSQDGKLEIGRELGAIRIDDAGHVFQVPCKLFLHRETLIQREYNRHLRDELKRTFGDAVALKSVDRTSLLPVTKLIASSAVDEVQIVQIDEFQLDSVSADANTSEALHQFGPGAHIVDDWKKMTWAFPSHADKSRLERVSAVPYYLNIGLLSVRKDFSGDLGEEIEWEQLQKLSKHSRWNQLEELFFDFASVSDESYNYLFFEMACGMGFSPKMQCLHCFCPIASWLDPLDGANSRVVEVAKVFYDLCRPAFVLKTRKHLSGRKLRPALTGRSAGAAVSRHWFTTLSDEFRGLDARGRETVDVRPMPRYRTVAGTWFIGVPAHSAAPSVAGVVMSTLSSRQEENVRLRHGVGLPVRKDHYESDVVDSLSPYFQLSTHIVRKSMENALHRSRFACYRECAPWISSYLKQILSLDDDSSRDHSIVDALRSLSRTLSRLSSGGSGRCRKCDPSFPRKGERD